ncbi:MAG: DUF3883 domain-containing protein [Syntrophales bacterium]|nr:DUF3883 domain-containing protein [Syntrophales bacterium]
MKTSTQGVNIANKASEIEQSTFSDKIIQKTIAEIRSFLDELANGTSRYKSIHNLTEQIEHQYHGRFLIELMQNAHDALFEEAVDGDKGRLEIIINTEEKPYGALYVANDGTPFTDSNFESLSNFGQSDKDPEKHIGNKGIGFRSVLEITHTPEIYSRSDMTSKPFDGYCFCFQPDVTEQFEGPIKELLNGIDQPLVFLDAAIPLIEWGEKKLRLFRSKFSSENFDFILSELGYLSPYMMPIPINASQKTDQIKKFEDSGLSTVIRLPFVSEDARDLAISIVDSLNENTILFLGRVKAFWIDSGRSQRLVGRKKVFLNDPENGQEINIEITKTDNGDMPSKRYWLWERTIGGEDNPIETEEIEAAVCNLPGKWPGMKKATVALAVKIDDCPEKGNINIFLPTELASGCGAHINGPFYGDISRTYIEFDHPFNELLLRKIAEKALNGVFSRLAGKGLDEGRAIIDILSPFPDIGEHGSRWWSFVRNECKEMNLEIKEENICLTDHGWMKITESNLLPELDEPKIITEKVLRTEATFPVFHKNTVSREPLIRELYNALNISILPKDEWIADTIEKIAEKFHRKGKRADWTGFWKDVSKLLPENSEKLKGKKVLLGTDDDLHASDDKTAVFFRPRITGTDDEVLSTDAIDSIPMRLRPYIAFLDERIETHVPGRQGGIQTTPIHRYLSSDLVQTFGVEQILRNVLIPALPELPVVLESKKGRLCRDIIQWGLRLVANLVARDKGEGTLIYLGRLPVPCRGGWFPLRETSFGPGWMNTVGEELARYLEEAGTKECNEALKKLMLPPDHKLWKGLASQNQEILARAGAFDGLRLKEIVPDDWKSKFYVCGGIEVNLPANPPPCFDEETWGLYVDDASNNLRPYFDGPFDYEVKEFFVFPGLEKFHGLNNFIRVALMTILLRSLPNWNEDWDNPLSIEKIGGQSHSFEPESPLHFWLKRTPWLITESNGIYESFCPEERWHVPSIVLAGRAHQFSHLNPLPREIAGILDNSSQLADALENLGMPKFDLESHKNIGRLLRDLFRAWENPRTEISNRDIFLGQVRDAWRAFDPEEDDDFPEKLLLESRIVVMPSKDNPVFLPDATESSHAGLKLHSKPVVAEIQPKDAKRLSKWFKETYGKGIHLASELTDGPLVNGQPWEGGEGELLCDSEIKWLIPVILSVFAFAGGQAHGTQTKTFLRATQMLRESKVCWVPNLEVGLWHDGNIIAMTSLPAMWMSDDKTLLSTENVKNSPSSLNKAIGHVVERADIDMPLKFVLSEIERTDEPSRDVLIKALSQLEISNSQFAEIEQLWLGDLSWTIRLIKPVLKAFDLNEELNELDGVESPEQLEEYLANCSTEHFNGKELLTLVRTSHGFYDLGEVLFDKFGSEFQLDKWNELLVGLGEEPIKNEDAIEQFQDHLSSALTPLRSVLRKIVKDNPGVDLFTDLSDQVEAIPCPEELKVKYWFVEFSSVMKVIRPLFASWKASRDELDTIDSSRTPEELIVKLEKLGLESTLDPLEIYSKNCERCRDILNSLKQIAIIWCLKNNVEVGYWGRETEVILDYIREILDKEGYFDFWDNQQAYSILEQLPKQDTQSNFWNAFVGCENLEDLMTSLSISVNEREKAKEQLDRHQQEQQEKKRIVSVCGKNFDNSEENLSHLWNHIVDKIGEEHLPGLCFDNLAELREVTTAKKSGVGGKGGGRERKTVPSGRMSGAMKNLIGLAGEIHAYRSLLKNYGAGVVNPNCWISENSLRKYPQNKVNDRFGCDFMVRHERKTFYIEVKATSGDEEYFELGLSEIRLAVEKANRRRDKFLIIHVTNALSEMPEFQFLPNPYDKKHQRSYDIRNAGLQIRYNKKTS